ncbi:MAG: hypothetical protein JWM68_455 [Verrucomicrobiales bacterium]|nr:hypothetical protein [Verrucomicrobiales bacterium]
MRQLEKSEVIGRRVVDIIVSTPDKPVTMLDQSYSAGFLRLDSGDLINLGAYAPPLIACDEKDVRDLMRDKKYEKEFRPAIDQKIVELILPGETEDDDIRITTANGFVITFAASCFWIRPCIQSLDTPGGIATVPAGVSAQRRVWWKFWSR